MAFHDRQRELAGSPVVPADVVGPAPCPFPDLGAFPLRPRRPTGGAAEPGRSMRRGFSVAQRPWGHQHGNSETVWRRGHGAHSANAPMAPMA